MTKLRHLKNSVLTLWMKKLRPSKAREVSQYAGVLETTPIGAWKFFHLCSVPEDGTWVFCIQNWCSVCCTLSPVVRVLSEAGAHPKSALPLRHFLFTPPSHRPLSEQGRKPRKSYWGGTRVGPGHAAVPALSTRGLWWVSRAFSGSPKITYSHSSCAWKTSSVINHIS